MKKKRKSLIERLVQIRNEKKMSIDELADRAMIHSRLVEQIEKGMVSPSTGALKAISKALDIHLADLFQEVGLSDEEIKEMDTAAEVAHIKKVKRKVLDVKGSRSVYHYMTPTKAERNLEMLYHEVEPKASGGDWLSHEGEECCFVLKGKFRIYYGDEAYDLDEGDTLWFKSYKRHKWENPSDKITTVVWAITPPWF
jgi:transcriptional regulator with XRE-family HTH domain